MYVSLAEMHFYGEGTGGIGTSSKANRHPVHHLYSCIEVIPRQSFIIHCLLHLLPCNANANLSNASKRQISSVGQVLPTYLNCPCNQIRLPTNCLKWNSHTFPDPNPKILNPNSIAPSTFECLKPKVGEYASEFAWRPWGHLCTYLK